MLLGPDVRFEVILVRFTRRDDFLKLSVPSDRVAFHLQKVIRLADEILFLTDLSSLNQDQSPDDMSSGL